MTVYPPVRSTTARISATPTCPHRNPAVKRAALALATSAAPPPAWSSAQAKMSKTCPTLGWGEPS